MKNEKEIKYVHKLLTMLGFSCKPTLRKERQNMWSLYLGAKQLQKYYELIGFGVQEKRQKILEKAIQKVIVSPHVILEDFERGGVINGKEDAIRHRSRTKSVF